MMQLLALDLGILDTSYDIVEAVANGGIAQAEQLGHGLEGTAGLDKLPDEGLVLDGQPSQDGQVEGTADFCLACGAAQPFDL